MFDRKASTPTTLSSKDLILKRNKSIIVYFKSLSQLCRFTGLVFDLIIVGVLVSVLAYNSDDPSLASFSVFCAKIRHVFVLNLIGAKV